jgi:proton-translocating NADH-quinone oxidoreductase chain N
MVANSSFFLVVLPELLQVFLINGLLLFSMGFAVPTKTLPYSKPYTKWNISSIIAPTLLTEPIVQLILLAVASSTILYLNVGFSYKLLNGLILDNLGQFMSVFLCVAAMATLSLGMHGLKRFSSYEFLLILWLSMIGMLCLIKSHSLLALYLSIELQSLSFYMLAAMQSRTEASAEAGLKYFILSAFSSAMLLLGMALVYAATGSQSFPDLAMLINHFTFISYPYQMDLFVGLGCICVSLLFKLGAAPFHAWIADVYEGSNTSITAWFAITAKIAVATALIRMNSPNTLLYLLTAVAIISLILGSLSALRQVKLKRLMAFSAVTNAGWFVLALIVGQWQFLVIHLIMYTILSLNLFSIFALPLFRTHPCLAYRTRVLKGGNLVDHGADSSHLKYLTDLNQLNKTNSSLAFAVTISMFSLAGIPPLAGFYSKYLIINAVVQTEHYLILTVALAAAVISAFYYLRVVKRIYFTPTSNTQFFTIHELSPNAYVTSISTGITILFLIKPQWFVAFI